MATKFHFQQGEEEQAALGRLTAELMSRAYLLDMTQVGGEWQVLAFRKDHVLFTYVYRGKRPWFTVSGPEENVCLTIKVHLPEGEPC